MPRRPALAPLAALLLAAPAAAQAPSRPPAALVPADDPSYALIDELAALVPVRGLVAGQRPYGRRELVRLAREACATLARDTTAGDARR
ncbi:hypothetical protein, partial [Roseisolibacter sp. H3M3-2]|uniref:hypothetical protein n=1 Tax=Roseisolibacter sp. H3M3-2 TaxID=3031323 RepID=UPI0023D9AA1A